MKMDKITGKVDEMELEALAGEDVNGAGTVTIIPVITATIVATYMWGGCPTGACTKSCNK